MKYLMSFLLAVVLLALVATPADAFFRRRQQNVVVNVGVPAAAVVHQVAVVRQRVAFAAVAHSYGYAAAVPAQVALAAPAVYAAPAVQAQVAAAAPVVAAPAPVAAPVAAPVYAAPLAAPVAACGTVAAAAVYAAPVQLQFAPVAVPYTFRLRTFGVRYGY